MPVAQSSVAGRTALTARAFVVTTWAIFSVAILLLDAPSPRGIYYLINAVGISGLCVSIVWFVVAPKWRLACGTVSVLFVLVYLLRWSLQIEDIYSTSPALGVGTAVERLIHVWGSVFESNRAKYGLPWALLAAYWDVFVVPIQILVAAFVLSHQRRDRERIAQASS